MRYVYNKFYGDKKTPKGSFPANLLAILNSIGKAIRKPPMSLFDNGDFLILLNQIMKNRKMRGFREGRSIRQVESIT